MEDTDAKERKTALDILASIDSSVAYEVLGNSVNRQDTTPDVRMYAAFTIAEKSQGKDLRALPGLLEALRQKPSELYERAERDLQKFGDDAIPTLLVALDDDWSETRRRAIRLLGKLQAKSAVLKILDLLRNDDPLRSDAVDALELIGDADAVPGLTEALHDESSGIRRRVVEVLGKFKHPFAVPGLILVLGDEEEQVRDAAYKALVQIGESSIAELLRVLSHENVNVVSLATAALGDLGYAGAIPPILSNL